MCLGSLDDKHIKYQGKNVYFIVFYAPSFYLGQTCMFGAMDYLIHLENFLKMLRKINRIVSLHVNLV